MANLKEVQLIRSMNSNQAAKSFLSSQVLENLKEVYYNGRLKGENKMPEITKSIEKKILKLKIIHFNIMTKNLYLLLVNLDAYCYNVTHIITGT